MSAKIVLVNDDQQFVDEASTALKHEGHSVTAFIDPLAALDALRAAERVDLLITRVLYPKGKPHGISLALMSREKFPGLRVLFTALSEFEEHTGVIGEFVRLPVELPDFLMIVHLMLDPKSATAEQQPVKSG